MALEIYFFQKTIMKNKEKGRNTQVHRYLVRPRGRHVVIKQSVNNLRIERYQKAEHRSRPVMPHTPSRGAQSAADTACWVAWELRAAALQCMEGNVPWQTSRTYLYRDALP